MNKEHVYQLLDETEETYYLVGIFDSIGSAVVFMSGIKKPISDSISEYQELVLRKVELNKTEWALKGDPVLKLEIKEVLNLDGIEEGWEVTEWGWKKQENVPGKWDFGFIRREKND